MTSARNTPIFLAAALLASALAQTAAAQLAAYLAPIRQATTAAPPEGYTLITNDGLGTNPQPITWEVLFENPTGNRETAVYDIDIWAGFTGGSLTLVCPAASDWERLPPSVDPTTDITCTASTLQVRNIVIEPCSRERLRFDTDIDTTGFSPGEWVCAGGVVTASTVVDTVNPIPNAEPQPEVDPTNPDHTCLTWDSFTSAGSGGVGRLFVHQTVRDGDRTPFLPGDTFFTEAWFDALHFQVPIPPFDLEVFQQNTDIGWGLIPLPPQLVHTAWIREPMNPPATYTYVAASNELSVVGGPGPAPPLDDITDIVEWEGRIECNAQSEQAYGFTPSLLLAGPGPAEGEDVSTLADMNDDPTITVFTPSFEPEGNPPESLKTITDADGSGDAQPGEVLTVSVTFFHEGTCPQVYMPCECAATEIEVVDMFDPPSLPLIDFATVSNITDNGLARGPDTVHWDPTRGSTIPPVAPGFSHTVSFQVQVAATATDGATIRNVARVSSYHSKRLADACGGSSFTELEASIQVAVPSVGAAVSKTVAPPTGPYRPGETLTYTVEVSNSGQTDLADIEVYDCLDPAIVGWPITVNDGGSVGMLPAPVPPCPSGQWIRWPNIPSLPVASTPLTFRFEVEIPLCTADDTGFDNVATVDNAQLPNPVDSNNVSLAVCTPTLAVTKTSLSGPGPFTPGQMIDWQIDVSNSNPGCDASNVIVQDTFPPELTVVSVTLPAGCGVSGQTVDCTAATVSAATPAQFVIQTTVGSVLTPVNVCNTAFVASSDQCDQAGPSSAPACVDLDPGVTCLVGNLNPISPLKAAKDTAAPATDIYFEWTADPAGPPEYHVNVVQGPKPNLLDPSVTGNGVTQCDVPGLSCVDTAVPAPTWMGVLFYEVLSACGDTDEGPF